MQTLITGAGLIGCRTAALLAARGDPVVLLDVRPDRGAMACIAGLDAVQIETGDIRDRAAMRELFERLGVTQVVHTAAALSMAIRQTPTLTATSTSVAPSICWMLLVRRESGVLCWHRQRRWCIRSLRARTMRRSRKISRSTWCANARAACMRRASWPPNSLTQHYADQFGLSIGVLRYSAVLGLWGGANNSVPHRVPATLLGHGVVNGQVRVSDPLLLWSGGDNFIDARDVARANVAALDAADLPSRVYTIGSGSLARFTDFVAAARQVRPRLRHADVVLPPTGFAGFAHQRDRPFDVAGPARLGFSAQHDLVDSMCEAARSCPRAARSNQAD